MFPIYLLVLVLVYLISQRSTYPKENHFPCQNADGGVATYELTRSYPWLEVTPLYLIQISNILKLDNIYFFFCCICETKLSLTTPPLLCLSSSLVTSFAYISWQLINPSETFGDIVIDYSYDASIFHLMDILYVLEIFLESL